MANQDEQLIWQETNQKNLLKTPILNVTQIHSISSQNKSGDYIILETKDWVITVPVIEKDGQKHFVLVQQWRHGAKELSIEFPGGVLNDKENPEKGALRELREETGYTAQKLTHLGTINPNPAIMRNHVHFFVAENLTNIGSQHLDSDEFINCSIVPIKEVFEKMGKNQYSHALMSAALFLYIQKFSKDIVF
ncbi:MAG: NUDIX hydrolase [Treponema sp.]|jgi:8-oxo-dGTP pyrophosphatase MutT (NUDIX family)|nr:NUDIX hydrolase [Treponema sp.]